MADQDISERLRPKITINGKLKSIKDSMRLMEENEKRWNQLYAEKVVLGIVGTFFHNRFCRENFPGVESLNDTQLDKVNTHEENLSPREVADKLKEYAGGWEMTLDHPYIIKETREVLIRDIDAARRLETHFLQFT